MKQQDILGIPWGNIDLSIYSAIEGVLSTIKQRYPKDFARIKKRVRRIITKQFYGEGCFSQDEYQSKTFFLHEDPEFWEDSGTIIINTSILKKYSRDDVSHTIAHEFGHVMVSEKKFKQYFKNIFTFFALEYGREQYEDPIFLTNLYVAEAIYTQENLANHYAKKWGYLSSKSQWFDANSVALVMCNTNVVVELQVDDKYNFKDSYIVHSDWNKSDLKRYKKIKHSLHTLELLIEINGLNK